MIDTFTGNDANDVWLSAVELFRNGARVRRQKSRAGLTKEILHVGFAIADPRQRWVISRFPTLNPAFAIVEVVWILTGRRDSKFLNYWNPQLPKYAGICREYHGAYGYRLKYHFGIDQLLRAFEVLKRNPDSRQVLLQIWDPEIDLPTSEGRPTSEDIPCNVISLLKVRGKKLEWLQVIRSNDIFLGVPYNFVQFTYLQEVMAGWLKLKLGSYNQISDSLHIYKKASKDVFSSSKIVPEKNTDVLVEDKELSDALFQEMAQRIGEIARKDVNREQVLAAANWSTVPMAYQNMLRVVAAEAARKAGLFETAREIMHSCTNPAFVQLWQMWLSRTSKRKS